ncbi:hypothetical protein [Streptomyces chartreusis]|uniref:hypothetical protein n=1 Tax=Streptomyces chartreusis TaxID=1969 RepID=UPI00339EFF24
MACGSHDVEAEGHSSPQLLEPAEAAFYDMAGLVRLDIEGGGRPPFDPRRLTTRDLVSAFRDDRSELCRREPDRMAREECALLAMAAGFWDARNRPSAAPH